MSREITPELIAKLEELTPDKPLSMVTKKTLVSVGVWAYEVLPELLNLYKQVHYDQLYGRTDVTS